MMLTELMARGEVDPQEAFSSEKLGSSRGTQQVTSHPAAFGGAQQGAARMNTGCESEKRTITMNGNYQPMRTPKKDITEKNNSLRSGSPHTRMNF
jgi:hypothetical protein